MKKILFLLLLTVASYGQTYQNPTFGTIKTMTAPTVTTTPHLGTVETNGTISKITPANLPVSTATTNALELETDVSAGAITGFALTNNGDGTVNIASGTAFLRTTNDPYAQIIKYPISAVTNLALTDNANNYVLVDYNAGSPTLTVTTNASTINTQTNSLAYVIARIGNNLEYLNLVGQNVDPNAKLRIRFLNQEGIRRASGAVLGFSNRNLTLTSSVLFSGLIRINAAAFNTASPDTFTLAYNNGSVWTRTTGQTQINNTEYNVSGTLTTMPNNTFRTDYVYLLPNNPSKLYVIMGNTTYGSLTLAKGAPRPSSLPVELQVLGLEVGRLFIEKNSAAMAEVQSSFANDFIGAAIPEHNSLTGLQGGTSGEYNHLTNAQVALVNGSEQTANKATSFSTVNNTLYPTVQAVKTYADGLVVGLLNDRGSYDASINLFPSTGGSGTSGAILKGDIWYVGVAGTLGGKSVAIGDSFRALVDTPGQTAGNWSLLSSNLSYVPANDANVVHLSGAETISGAKTSTGGFIMNSGLHSSSTGVVVASSGSGTDFFINSKNISFGASLSTSSITGSDKTFTFPNTSGTFALTSDLSNYVALTGNQSIAGNKTFTGQTAITNSSGGDGILLTTSSTGRGIRLNSITGSTTDLLQFQRNGVETGKVDYLGNITAPSFIKSGATSTDALLAGGGTLANPLNGSLTNGYLPKATGTNSLGNSVWQESSTGGRLFDTTDDGVNKLQVSGSGVFQGLSTNTTSESLRIIHNSGFVSGYNSANTTRTGFLAFNSFTNSQLMVDINQGLVIGTNGLVRLTITNSGVFNINNLSGTGTRVITADASGNLSATNTLNDLVLTGTPTAPTATVGTNTTQIATTAFVQTATSAVRPYLVYTALLTQSGTGAPTATVLENTLGGTVVWSRDSAGFYKATLSGAFTNNKTFISLKPYSAYNTEVKSSRLGSNDIGVSTFNTSGTQADDIMVGVQDFEIRVYP